jgi:acetylornithine/succinyldiaminopimelate/putrescine aminotransferase
LTHHNIDLDGEGNQIWPPSFEQLIPIILVAAKYLSGGIEPCAGIAAKDEILGDNLEFPSGSTFAGTPASLAYRRDGILNDGSVPFR